MTMGDAVGSVFGNYATFSGRARRAEYWWFILFVFFVNIGVSIIDSIFLGFSGAGPVGLIFSLAIAIPTIALTARRLHDVNKSGWWQLIYLAPFLGVIIMLIWQCTRGTIGDNRFGPDPVIDAPVSEPAA